MWVGVVSESVFLSVAGEPTTLKVLRLVSKTVPYRENKHAFPHADKKVCNSYLNTA